MTHAESLNWAIKKIAPSAADFGRDVERVRELMQDNFDGVILAELAVEALDRSKGQAERWRAQAKFFAELAARMQRKE